MLPIKFIANGQLYMKHRYIYETEDKLYCVHSWVTQDWKVKTTQCIYIYMLQRVSLRMHIYSINYQLTDLYHGTLNTSVPQVPHVILSSIPAPLPKPFHLFNCLQKWLSVSPYDIKYLEHQLLMHRPLYQTAVF